LVSRRLFLSLALTVIVASQPGAGPHHFLPFVPISAYGFSSVLAAPAAAGRLETTAIELAIMVVIPLLIFFGPIELWRTTRFAREFVLLQTEKRKIKELQALHEQYPMAEIGPSDHAHYEDTFYRAFLIFQGAPLSIDFASWMDLEFAGVSETRIISWLEHCRVPVWILPMGVPFTIDSYYTHLPLFSKDFRRTLFIKYKLIEEREFYGVWKCSMAPIGGRAFNS
jgi:hypothetical protein